MGCENMTIDETIEKTIKALKGSDEALATHSHQVKMAAMLGMDALGYDSNGRLNYSRFEKGKNGKPGDGAKVVGDAANKYMNKILTSRINAAISNDSAAKWNPKKLAEDEIARLQGSGYFGITAQEISEQAAEMKERFTPEILMKNNAKQIERVQTVIRKTPLSIANGLDADEVFDYVNLTETNQLYNNLKRDDVTPIQLLSLLDVYRQEKAITETMLKQMGLYRKAA